MEISFKICFTLLSRVGMRSGLCPTVPGFLKPTQTGVVLRQLQLIFQWYKYRQQLSNVRHGVVTESMCSSTTAKGNALAISCGSSSELSPGEKVPSSQIRQRGWISDTIFPPYHLKSGFATTQSPSAHRPHIPGPWCRTSWSFFPPSENKIKSLNCWISGDYLMTITHSCLAESLAPCVLVTICSFLRQQINLSGIRGLYGLS